MKKRAIISVSDKKGVVGFARELCRLGYEVIATGGTERILSTHGVIVTPVEQVTGFPECLDGRVKTLDPHIFAGILAKNSEAHQTALDTLGLTNIDIIVVNLYPFRQTILDKTRTAADCVENIDIGGPSMLRAAAKNFERVTVITDPCDYACVLQELEQVGETSLETRRRLALRVFEHTAAYDALIADFFAKQIYGEIPLENGYRPQELTQSYRLISGLRYGENSHQEASYYADSLPINLTLPEAQQIQGKELSYNNINDTNAALQLVLEFTKPAAVAVKHANPCGVAIADTINGAWQKAYAADPVSIYGGIVACNREVTEEIAQDMSKIFLEVVIAPSFAPEALEIFAKKKALRLLVLAGLGEDHRVPSLPQAKTIPGGLLFQSADNNVYEKAQLSVATKTAPDNQMLEDMHFGMTIVKHVKSNAIVLVKDGMSVGIGPGQPNRVTACAIAIKNAGEKANGAILASDAFIPFRDTVDVAVAAGIKGIVQPGGSIHDDEAILAADEAQIPMIMTKVRHFCH